MIWDSIPNAKNPKNRTPLYLMSSSSDSESGKSAKIQLSHNRFINVNSFKGRDYINIREYYKDREGMMRPTKKGIMLRIDEWKKLTKSVH